MGVHEVTAPQTFHDVLARVQRQRDALEDAVGKLSSHRGRGHAAEGKVTAEVDASGALVSLVIHESLTRLSATEVAGHILTAAQNASTASESARRAVLSTMASALGARTG
ncbi:YbaB/EbfC family nucleoid-associated protein [Hoyosella subflava]|uniref:YbaB/EbfC family nucleoid-associated protein n=1 Tax=Hoyosella subflava TaxID=639313 RepID=UPI0002FFE25A|nr:YbaB/EbfC family nucleoid-associated protein [Hoyosella subflava]